jgi:hypothetical protein
LSELGLIAGKKDVIAEDEAEDDQGASAEAHEQDDDVKERFIL